MSISVRDLKPGERVVLNCPTARRGDAKREALFEGIFDSAEASRERGGFVARQLPMSAEAIAGFRDQSGPWARFLVESRGSAESIVELVVAFVVDRDGGMREEEGRRVFIERRVRVGQG